MGKHARPPGPSGAPPAEPALTRYPTSTGFTTAPPALVPLQWDQPGHRRLRGSQTTFGIFGRLVMTGLILLFVAWILSGGPFAFFIVPAIPALAWIMKDNWRKAPERRAPEPTRPVEGPRVGARDPFAPLAAEAVFDPHVRPPEAGATTA